MNLRLILQPVFPGSMSKKINGRINRKEFGLHWNALTEAGGMVVADEVRLVMNIELANQQ